MRLFILLATNICDFDFDFEYKRATTIIKHLLFSVVLTKDINI